MRFWKTITDRRQGVDEIDDSFFWAQPSRCCDYRAAVRQHAPFPKLVPRALAVLRTDIPFIDCVQDNARLPRESPLRRKLKALRLREADNPVCETDGPAVCRFVQAHLPIFACPAAQETGDWN